MKTLRPFALSRISIALVGAAGIAGAGPAAAEDIDIYGSQAAAGGSNLMILLDNTSNWSANNQAWSKTSVNTKCLASAGMTAATCDTLVTAIFGSESSLKQGQVELRALKYVLNTMVCDGSGKLKVNVGLSMIGSQTQRSNGDSNGFIRFAVQPLTGDASTGSCKAILDSLTEIDDKITDPSFKAPSSADYSAPLYEIFKYFGGHSNPTLVTANPSNPAAGSPTGAQGYGPIRYSKSQTIEDPAAFTDSTKNVYRSPLGTTGACDNNVLAIIGNQYPNAEPNAGPTLFQGLNYTFALTGATTDTNRRADEWAHFLRNGDVSSLVGQQYIKTTTVNVYNAQEDTSQTRLLKSMATAGGGNYFVVDGDLVKLKTAFEDIVARAAAVNSVFTASTLPVSTTTQGSYLNQVFIAMFRPDAERDPRWMGNLKQYEIGRDNLGTLRLMDANGRDALGSTSGFFNSTSRSFWTHDSVYFSQMPVGTPPSASDSPDGPTVEKGGVAQVLREANLQNNTARNVYTLPLTGYTNGAALSATPFATTNTALSGTFSNDQIAWIRGANNIPQSSDSYETAGSYTNSSNEVTVLPSTGARPSMHGDVLHSRPVALNYGNADVVVFYGANDGFLRAVDGRKTGTTAGQELWSFIAPEHYSMLTRLYNNSPALFLPSTTSTGAEANRVAASDEKKSYAMDGPIGVFARYSNNTIQEAIIYAGMRRGGSAVYAFDVTSKTAPVLKFKIAAGGSYDKLAQTWSMARPVVFPTSAGSVFVDPILVMGGGYDPAEDGNGSAGIGNVVYVINGRTGAKLAELATDYSVAADVTVVDSNGDGTYDRGYAADVRGNVYRINMTNSSGTLLAPSSWTIRKIFTGVTSTKVFGAPDVVPTREFVAVMVGTGDREKPLDATTNDNFLVIKDTIIGQTDRSALALSDLSMVGEVTGTSFSVQQRTADATTINNGCYVKLSTAGEKVVNTPFTIAGVTYFGTNRPTPSTEQSCSANLGQARAYQFPLFCGQAASVVLAGGGLPPSPVGGFVSMPTTQANGSTREELVPFVIGGGGGPAGGSGSGGTAPACGSGGNSALDPGDVCPAVAPVRKRQHYRIHNSNR